LLQVLFSFMTHGNFSTEVTNEKARMTIIIY